MSEVFESSAFAGVLLSLSIYWLGCLAKKKLKLAIVNPLLIAIAGTIAFLLVFGVDYDTYYSGAKYLSWLLTPATVCLAVPLYEQIDMLKENRLAILLGIAAGVLTSLGSVLIFALLMKLDHCTYVTLLPKSVTTAIGVAVSEELGGYPAITVAVIVLTGITGNVLAEGICRVFRITEPVAKGIGIGSASHALGTAKAMEIGEIEGAMSSLSIAVSGVLTVVAAALFAQFL